MSNGEGSSSSNASNAIPITSLSVSELKGLREKFDVEVQRMQSNRLQLQRVLQAFQNSEASIQRLSQTKIGDEMLLPLTGSLYVTGRVASVEKVIVDVGTGYFVERSVGEGMDYCKRKVEYLSKNVKEMGQVLLEKQKVLGTITQVLEGKLSTEKSS